MNLRHLVSLTALAGACALSQPALATVYCVNNVSNLAAAFNSANAADEGTVQEIRVRPGTYAVSAGLEFNPAGDKDGKNFSLTGGWNSDYSARTINSSATVLNAENGSTDVRVFGTGSLDGTAFIVMELLTGPNLDQYLRARPDQRLPCDEALALVLPALAALHAIHERGYVHRDIKPGNMLVTSEAGHPPTAVVIDLGLVKADRALRTVDSPPTTDVNRMLCTPGYISPEQALGRAVDRRSDVYSMGMTLYRVLTGRLPFHEAHGKHMAAILARHIHAEPTLIAEAAGTAEIPPAVAAVVESALRKDPTDSPQSMPLRISK